MEGGWLAGAAYMLRKGFWTRPQRILYTLLAIALGAIAFGATDADDLDHG